METIDILQLIYDRSGVDEKVNLQRAFPDVRFVPGKLTLPDIVVKRIEYKDIRHVGRFRPEDGGLLDLYAVHDIVERPHNSKEFSTLYIHDPDKLALHTGPYRIVKYFCDYGIRTDVNTCNEVECQLPDLFARPPFLYYKYKLTWRHPPWRTHQEYLEELGRLMAECRVKHNRYIVPGQS